MGTKLVISYDNNGVQGEITEYHMNTQAAYKAQEAITKRLGHSIKVTKVQVLTVKKHLEIAPVIQLSQTDKHYTEVK